MTQPPVPLPCSPHLSAIFLLSGCGENGQIGILEGLRCQGIALPEEQCSLSLVSSAFLSLDI